MREAPGPKAFDPVNPGYYQGDDVAQFIWRHKLGFFEGVIVKYIVRHDKKDGLRDLKKVRWYIDFLIRMTEGEAAR